MKFPSTVSINVYKAYINDETINVSKNKTINCVDLKWNYQIPKSLRIIVLDSIIQNWHEIPVLSNIPKQADKNYILENLDVNLPIKILSTHIKDDIFWKRCFQSRWNSFIPQVDKRNWISVYMEKDLSEMLENLEPCAYDQEEMQSVLEIAGPYVEELNISSLRPSMEERADHIPFDFILSNLTELKMFRVSYIAKSIGPNFYLGCSNLSMNDAVCLCRGLKKTYDLLEFCIFSTKLDISIMKLFAKSLDKGCPNLATLNLSNCQIGDNGFMQFAGVLNVESFVNLKRLVLLNNFFSQKTAFVLSRIIKNRRIEYLDLSLNPIGSEGAASIFSIIRKLPIKTLNLNACSITDSIGRILLRLILENKTLIHFNMANNNLGNTLGLNIYQVIGFNKWLKKLDLRNTNIPIKLRKNIASVLFQNRDKL